MYAFRTSLNNHARLNYYIIITESTFSFIIRYDSDIHTGIHKKLKMFN